MNLEVHFIGHRGCRVDSDENTLQAFRMALENGADIIELDIHKTKDNKLVVIHDKTIDRTTNGKGEVKELTSAKIKEFRTKKKGFLIPLLSEVLDAYKTKLNFIIELKGENVREPLIKMVRKKGLIDNCVFSSRDLGELFLLKSEMPKSKICYNITKGIGLTLNTLIKQRTIPNQINIINLDAKLINNDIINLCHEQDVLIYAWNFINCTKPIEKIKQLISNGIDGVLFDSCTDMALIKKWKNSVY